MNTGQMALTIAAFMLLGIVMLNFRSANFQNSTVLEGNEYTQRAVAIGRSLIEEMSRKPFDAAMNSKKVVRLSDLTSCGPGWGEVYPHFNDLDDYHRSEFYSPEAGVTPGSETPSCLHDTWGYTVRVRVEYVSPSNPDLTSTSRTFTKRVMLWISNEFSEDTVTMSYIAAY